MFGFKKTALVLVGTLVLGLVSTGMAQDDGGVTDGEGGINLLGGGGGGATGGGNSVGGGGGSMSGGGGATAGTVGMPATHWDWYLQTAAVDKATTLAEMRHSTDALIELLEKREIERYSWMHTGIDRHRDAYWDLQRELDRWQRHRWKVIRDHYDGRMSDLDYVALNDSSTDTETERTTLVASRNRVHQLARGTFG